MSGEDQQARVEADGAVGALAASGVPVRPGADRDAVGGVVPRWVAEPADADGCAAVAAAAARDGLALVPRGAGTKIGWGAPLRRCDVVLDVSALNRVDHAAGDLVVEAGAGTPVEDLADVLGASGQRLPVDPVVPGSTVGGVVATGLSGPGRMLYGPVRDLILGMTVVRADGVAASSGGRVVKNVAGYDLGKLHAGALGTLGIITSVTFRLRPVPPAAHTVSARADDPARARELVASVQRSHTAPTAIEVDRPAAGAVTVHVLLEGPKDGIRARADEVSSLLPGSSVSEDLPEGWGELPGGPGDTLLKLTSPPARLPAVLDALAEAAPDAGPLPVRGSAGSGVLFSALPSATDPVNAVRAVASLRARVEEATGGHGSLTVLDAPRPVHDAGLDPWGTVPGLPLMRSIKKNLDPDGVLSPGRFAGGI
ncbi:FAD-binding oxidoreductase [Nocardiopsis suaedae]|uniref:FAD-binding oxidoreductase n=1 Tax=Nocardiopsis suaedae TaxID=3018444 RepID=A0ABT4TE55_9ACTN|nr:FAD-binding oxidoreductase [Nocardiopsis suaedae]MDA2802920.1 FAD-binding oxidoreductase [Nocardiopsis suaedae]